MKTINETKKRLEKVNNLYDFQKEFYEENEKNPRPGQFVYDTYDGKRRKVHAISGKLYFIGPEHEPVFRNEFIFPLPKKTYRKSLIE